MADQDAARPLFRKLAIGLAIFLWLLSIIQSIYFFIPIVSGGTGDNYLAIGSLCCFFAGAWLSRLGLKGR
jgi:hypothetical protein